MTSEQAKAHGLGPSRQIELLKNMVDVMFDCRHTQAKLARNLLVRESVVEQR